MEPLYAGVDLGGTTMSCVLAQADGAVICERSASTHSHEGPQGVLLRIAALVDGLASECGRRPVALGMAAPGLIDRRLGVTKFFPNMPTQWRDVPVSDTLEPKVGCPVFLLNDVRTATLGELTYGHGRSANTMAFFSLGTGIGGGVVIDRKLRLGPLGAAGELGHQIVHPDGPRCGCGARGCIEALASGPAITAEGVRLMLSGQAPELHRLTEGDASRVTPKTMTEAAGADAPVREAICRAAFYLGLGIVNTVVTLHPDLIVLGGGVAQIGPLLFDTVRETLRERVGMFPVDGVEIKPSLLGTRAGSLGAVALAVERGLVD